MCGSFAHIALIARFILFRFGVQCRQPHERCPASPDGEDDVSVDLIVIDVIHVGV